MISETHPFNKGDTYEVTAEGCQLHGWNPIQFNGLQGWVKNLNVGDILTCAGTSMTRGDGVPIVKWKDKDNRPLAIDCAFSPSTGGMWFQKPDVTKLRLVAPAPVTVPKAKTSAPAP